MRSIIVGVATVVAAAVMGTAHAKQVSICNASPVEAYVAVSSETQTNGWYAVLPGQCQTFGVEGQQFYYHAAAWDDLAKWLGRGSALRWDGFSSRCIHPTEAFRLPANGQCAQRAGFSGVTLTHEHHTVTLYEGNHKGIALSDAPELRRVLIGRMEYEQILIRGEGREAPFQLGVWMQAGGDGVVITQIQPGMPAEAEGLVTGDKIVALDGYTVTTPQDVANILDNIDILRADPVAMTVIRNGMRVDGTISPMFYEFNHREYQPGGGLPTFLWSTVNQIFLNFGNELACVSVIGLGESLQAVADDRDFNGKGFAADTANCSKQLNRDLAKKEVLYPTAARVAFWASLIVPEAAAMKATKLGRAMPLATRSRYISRKT